MLGIDQGKRVPAEIKESDKRLFMQEANDLGYSLKSILAILHISTTLFSKNSQIQELEYNKIREKILDYISTLDPTPARMKDVLLGIMAKHSLSFEAMCEIAIEKGLLINQADIDKLQDGIIRRTTHDKRYVLILRKWRESRS